MKKTILAAALLLGTIPNVALAGGDTSYKDTGNYVSPAMYYFRVEAGAAWSATDKGHWVSPGGQPGTWAFDDDTSFYGTIAIGRHLMPGVRGDISFGANFGQDFDGCRVPGGSGSRRDCGDASVSTSVDTYLLMANLFVEPLALLGHGGGAIRPFFTAGAGLAFNDMDTWTRINPSAPQPVRNFSGDTETSFAWSVGGGVSIDLAGMFSQNAALDITYRYVNAGEARGGSNPDVGSGIPQQPLNFDVEFHALTAGVRIPF
jgi:opacity protein-like surface antigen